LSATAYLANTLFEEWSYKAPKTENQKDEAEDPEDISTEIDINLSILTEVLSIYGSSGGRKNWRSEEQKEDDEDEPRGPLDRYFSGRNKKTTSLRMTYLGEAHPLRLLLYVHSIAIPSGP
jgi:hypothetical protein